MLTVHSDADWAANTRERKFTSGYLVCHNSTPVSCFSKRQGRVALSSNKAEYITLSEFSKEVKWIHGVMKELAISRDELTVIEIDNFGAIKQATSGKRAKHVYICYRFVKNWFMRRNRA